MDIMISKKMENMVANSSAIRAMFEEGNRLRKLYGDENVFDFSLGNPNVAAPEAIKKAIFELLEDEEEKNSRIEICNHYSFSIPKEEISILKKGILIDAENL